MPMLMILLQLNWYAIQQIKANHVCLFSLKTPNSAEYDHVWTLYHFLCCDYFILWHLRSSWKSRMFVLIYWKISKFFRACLWEASIKSIAVIYSIEFLQSCAITNKLGYHGQSYPIQDYQKVTLTNILICLVNGSGICLRSFDWFILQVCV